MKYIFRQQVIEYTEIEAENEEEAWEAFYRGDVDPFETDYSGIVTAEVNS